MEWFGDKAGDFQGLDDDDARVYFSPNPQNFKNSPGRKQNILQSDSHTQQPRLPPNTGVVTQEQTSTMGAAPKDAKDEVPVVSTELYESDFDGFVKVRAT